MNLDEIINGKSEILSEDYEALIAEVKRLRAYKEFAVGVEEWSHGASFIHFLATTVQGIRITGELDEDAMNHGCQQYYNGPNASSQASEARVKQLREGVRTLRIRFLNDIRRLINGEIDNDEIVDMYSGVFE